MITIIANNSGEMTPRSRPMPSTINSIRPRVFIRTPKLAERRHDNPPNRAAAKVPPNFPAVATAGKFGGTLAAARLGGLSWRLSASLGDLMNTRGLMELIVLGIGLDLGVISPELFAMMVIMALVTTLATAPILSALSAQQAAAAA